MSSYSEGQTHQLMNALENAKFSAGDLTRLAQNKKWLEQIRELTNGCAEIGPVVHKIDCDAEPSIPKEVGGKIETHLQEGTIQWDFRRFKLHTEYEQEQVLGGINGHEILKKLQHKGVLNACVLEYLLKHPKLIPEEWKKRIVYFWGTIYRSRNNDLYVTSIFWESQASYHRPDKGEWQRGSALLNSYHPFTHSPALIYLGP